MAAKRIYLPVTLAAAAVCAVTGCPRWENPGDAGPKPSPDGTIDIPSPVVNFLAPAGGSVDFKGKVSCPAPFAPCTYLWNFGDGRTSTLQDPGVIAFDKIGYYPVTFTVTSSASSGSVADATPGQAFITVWNGEFKDSFNRTALGWDQAGWRHPLLQDQTPYQDLEGDWLRITGAYHLPGSTALLAYPAVGNCHIEVTKRRHRDINTTHFSDIIIRFDPNKRNGSFIRIRIQEERAIYDNPVEIGVFKIISADDEHGWLINDSITHHELHHIDCIPDPQYGMCPTCGDFQDRNEDIRIIVDVAGPKITVSLAKALKPNDIIFTATATDDITTPYVYEGSVGLAQFEGTTYFDDFVLQRRP